MARRIPVVILAAVDALEREAALLPAMLDTPGLLVIDQQFATDHQPPDESEPSVVRSRISGPSGAIEQIETVLAHPCPGCAARENGIPALVRALDRHPQAIIFALPLGVDLLPAVEAFSPHLGPLGALRRVRLAGTTTVCTPDRILEEFREGHDGLLLQLVGADVVVITGGDEPVPAPTGSAVDLRERQIGSDLIDALRWGRSRRFDDPSEPWLSTALDLRHDDIALEQRMDPAGLEPGHGFASRVSAPGLVKSESGVWSMDLRSERPFHPERFMERLEELGAPDTVSRGRFWVPNRPDALCGWEAVSGQVCVGVAGLWDGEPDTRLIVVGVGESRLVARAFHESLLTQAEFDDGLHHWLGRPDPLAPYLGDPADLYRREPG